MKRFLLLFLAGGIAALGLPPASWLICVLGLLVILWQAASAKSLGAAGLAMLAGGFGWFAVSLYWISHSLFIGDAVYLFMLPLSALGLPFFLALFWAVAGLVGWRAGTSRSQKLIFIALATGLAEWARSWLLTGFPWNAPGQVFLATDGLAQMAALIGQNGLNLLLFAFLAGLGLGWENRRQAVFLMLPLLICFGWGQHRIITAPPLDPQPPAKVRLIQPAVPQAEKWQRAARPAHLQRLLELGLSEKPIPQLVIWPESAFAGFWPQEKQLLAQLARTALPEDGQLLTGLLRRGGPNHLLNSVMLLDDTGAELASADKQRLVPFGEYVPIRFLPFVEALAGPTDFAPGTEPALFVHPQLGHIRVLICYEVIFPGFIRGERRPDFLVNLTNDAWFGHTAGPYQHLAQSRLRAIEEGLPLLRVANTGISAGFDGFGRLLGQTRLGEAAALDLPVPAALAAPPYVRARQGGFLLLIFWLLGAALLLDRSGQKRQI